MTNLQYMHYVIKTLSNTPLTELDEKFLEYCKYYLTKKDNLPDELQNHLYNIYIKVLDY